MTRQRPRVPTGSGFADRERRAFQQRERHLDARPDEESEGDGPDPKRAAERDPGGERAQLDRCANGTDPDPRFSPESDHQRVARARAERAAEIEGAADADQGEPEREQADPPPELLVGEPL